MNVREMFLGRSQSVSGSGRGRRRAIARDDVGCPSSFTEEAEKLLAMATIGVTHRIVRSSLKALRAVTARWWRTPPPPIPLDLPLLAFLHDVVLGLRLRHSLVSVCGRATPLASVLRRRMVVGVKLDRGHLRVAAMWRRLVADQVGLTCDQVGCM